MKILGFLFLLAPFAFCGEPTLVYLVRHAEKADSSKDADLSTKGFTRADALASFFEKIQVDHLLATQFQRTQKTLAPLGTSKGLKVETLLAQNPERFVARVAEGEGKTFVIAGHSNTLPDLIQRFGGPNVTIDDSAYRDLFLLVIQENQITFQNFQLAP